MNANEFINVLERKIYRICQYSDNCVILEWITRKEIADFISNTNIEIESVYFQKYTTDNWETVWWWQIMLDK
jgi:hypothetical protein